MNPSDHERRIRRQDDEQAQAQAPRPAPAPPAAQQLASAVGNAAFTQMIASRAVLGRQPNPKTKKSDADPRAGGWNEKAREVGGAHRFPVKGVTGMGNQKLDAQQSTAESAVGRAVVVVPDAADLSKPFEALLMFHGLGIGYRERSKSGGPGPEGSVRDVEADMIPQQLAHSGRNIVGVLPQGLEQGGDRFGIPDPNTYVETVLKLAAPDIQAALPTANAPSAPKPMRVIAAGHSGGGRFAVAAAGEMQKTGAPADVDAWITRPRLFLFDGIHSADQVKDVRNVLELMVKEDIAILSKAPDPKKAVERRGIKFRSTFSSGSWGGYTGWNTGSDWSEPKKENGQVVKGPDNKPVMEKKSVPKGASLRDQIDDLFNTVGKGLGAVRDDVKAQYAIEGPVPGSHERTVGVGKSPKELNEKRDAAPAGLTGPAAAAGTPKYSGGGNLEKGLSGLPSDTVIPPPPPPKQGGLDLEYVPFLPEDDVAYA